MNTLHANIQKKKKKNKNKKKENTKTLGVETGAFAKTITIGTLDIVPKILKSNVTSVNEKNKYEKKKVIVETLAAAAIDAAIDACAANDAVAEPLKELLQGCYIVNNLVLTVITPSRTWSALRRGSASSSQHFATLLLSYKT
ncbi:hypothetical protein MJO29_013588 [Puccinia striiformis f. sp. tritici]|uniref:Uncharacterized protein n=1 Tax=Puccinia striiformis TaxID=27350 RepID=A0A2S4UEC7_9BASI|nr:hypothetical protein Pst134EB_026328 [Puccinia striiformis f. sp. tritici]KAI7941514.1 hypothetical protein MJO29_013588 [Puccinia striiformis f. sp. tritici]KAI9628340.1 hypothetical protein KEM48_011623 [Puccinia striiformis f. sp. tritici PST-130]POV95494.1 hypothetical protein PSTT_16228 [Puccinia striiformis]